MRIQSVKENNIKRTLSFKVNATSLSVKRTADINNEVKIEINDLFRKVLTGFTLSLVLPANHIQLLGLSRIASYLQLAKCAG